MIATALLFAAVATKTVTLDVKDEPVRNILASMQKQCAIRNLVVDPNVDGNGTFYLKEVPCKPAFDVVLRTLQLRATTYSDDLVSVSVDKR